MISADLLFELKTSISLAGKYRREGCVSKRHFAAPGVARLVGSGDIIVREELRGSETVGDEISRQSERKREIERETERGGQVDREGRGRGRSGGMETVRA